MPKPRDLNMIVSATNYYLLQVVGHQPGIVGVQNTVEMLVREAFEAGREYQRRKCEDES